MLVRLTAVVSTAMLLLAEGITGAAIAQTSPTITQPTPANGLQQTQNGSTTQPFTNGANGGSLGTGFTATPGTTTITIPNSTTQPGTNLPATGNTGVGNTITPGTSQGAINAPTTNTGFGNTITPGTSQGAISAPTTNTPSGGTIVPGTAQTGINAPTTNTPGFGNTITPGTSQGGINAPTTNTPSGGTIVPGTSQTGINAPTTNTTGVGNTITPGTSQGGISAPTTNTPGTGNTITPGTSQTGISAPTTNTPGAGNTIVPGTSQGGINSPTTNTPGSTTQPGINQAPLNGTNSGAAGGTTTQQGVTQPTTIVPSTGTQTLPGGVEIQVVPGPNTATPQAPASNSPTLQTPATRTPTPRSSGSTPFSRGFTPSGLRTGSTAGTAATRAQSTNVTTGNTQIPSAPTLQGSLDAQLLNATCAQNWQQAVQVVDRALSAPPANSQPLYRSQLVSYRGRLQSLAASRVRVPNWQQQCRG